MFYPTHNVIRPIAEEAAHILDMAAEVFQGDSLLFSDGDPSKCLQKGISDLNYSDFCEYHLAVREGEIEFSLEHSHQILGFEQEFVEALCDPHLRLTREARKRDLTKLTTYLAFCLFPALWLQGRYEDAVGYTTWLVERMTWFRHRNVLGAGNQGRGMDPDVRHLIAGPAAAAVIAYHPNCIELVAPPIAGKGRNRSSL